LQSVGLLLAGFPLASSSLQALIIVHGLVNNVTSHILRAESHNMMVAYTTLR